MEEPDSFTTSSGSSNYEEVPATIEGGKRLFYAGRNCYLIPEELYEYAGRVTTIDLSYNCIRDLEGLEQFSARLEELILDNNEITERTVFPTLHRLQLLSLSNNHITDLYEFIDAMDNKVPKLRYLSLLGNKACPDSLTQSDCDEEDYNRYRKYVIYKIPGLKFLDSKPVTPEERKEARRTGQFLRVVKPTTSEEDDNFDQSERSKYRPLPSETGSALPGNQQPAGTLKKSKNPYHGKHSEGNRFIRNKDL